MTAPPGDDAGSGRPRRRWGSPHAAQPSPSQRALALLVRREHSRKELGRKLRARGVADDDADAAVERMAEAGWQSNERFAEQLTRSRAMQGYGPVRIRAELAMHGLEADAIDAAMARHGEDWSRIAAELIQRRFGAAALADRSTQRKAGNFLYRRGFSLDQLRRALDGDPFDEEID